jgi:hypothetical protein
MSKIKTTIKMSGQKATIEGRQNGQRRPALIVKQPRKHMNVVRDFQKHKTGFYLCPQ